ncbi:MAG: hypothetical protein ACTSQG_00305 [Promethearchaeota archaeon]
MIDLIITMTTLISFLGIIIFLWSYYDTSRIEKKRIWKPLKAKWFEIFKEKNGFFLCNLKDKKSKKFSKTVLLYKGNIQDIATMEDSMEIQSKLIERYKKPPHIFSVNVFIWGELDRNGINWFDFSEYQDIEKTIYQPEYLKDKENVSKISKEILRYLYKTYKCDSEFYCLKFYYDIIKKCTGEKIAEFLYPQEVDKKNKKFKISTKRG